MKKLDNKGFTLVEVIAVVVIISVLSLLIVPSISGLLNRSKDNSYKDLKSSIILSCEEYINDNRYNINIDSCDNNGICDVSNVSVSFLVENGYLTPTGTDSNGDYIVNPKDKKSRMNMEDSLVKVTFDKNNKRFIYDLNDEDLKWKES